MRHQILACIVMTLAVSQSAADQIHFSNVIITTPKGYTVRSGRSLELNNSDKGLSVQISHIETVPKANEEEVQAIVQRIDGAADVTVSTTKPYQHRGGTATVAGGTATIGGVPSRFWVYVTPIEDQAIAAIAYASTPVTKSNQSELLNILRGIKARDNTLFDFDSFGLSSRWAAQGKIAVERKPPPMPFAADPERRERGSRGPAGAAVHLKAADNSIFFTKAKRVPTDWQPYETVSFWVYRDPDQQNSVTIELQLFQPNNRTRHWRRVTIDHQGWQQYTVPTRWMRWSDDGVPDWANVSRLGFFFRDAGDIWIDSITIEDADSELGASIIAKDLVAIAFPNGGKHIKVAEDRQVTVVTGTPAIDLPKLVNHLTSVRQTIEADFAFIPATAHVPKLVIAADKKSYQQFVTDYATALSGQVRTPNSDGFTLHDVSTSYWEPKYGTLRPVYTHEFVHSLLSHVLRIPNKQEWLHEGLATYYQLRFHPQANVAELVQKGIEDQKFSAPLPQVCNGEAIPNRLYWQAMTLVEMLLSTDKYKSQLPKLLATLRQSGSTNLEPHLRTVLGTDWEQLADDWRTHCRRRYAD